MIPTFVFDSSIELSREERKQFADCFTKDVNFDKPNLYVYEYISKWVSRLLSENGIEQTFPPNTKTNFEFKIRPKSVILGISNDSQNHVQLPNSIEKKRIVFRGIECRDTDLLFFNPNLKRFTTDFHPMRGIIRNAPSITHLIAMFFEHRFHWV